MRRSRRHFEPGLYGALRSATRWPGVPGSDCGCWRGRGAVWRVGSRCGGPACSAGSCRPSRTHARRDASPCKQAAPVNRPIGRSGRFGGLYFAESARYGKLSSAHPRFDPSHRPSHTHEARQICHPVQQAKVRERTNSPFLIREANFLCLIRKIAASHLWPPATPLDLDAQPVAGWVGPMLVRFECLAPHNLRCETHTDRHRQQRVTFFRVIWGRTGTHPKGVSRVFLSGYSPRLARA